MHSKKSKPKQKVSFDAIGTRWVIETYGSPIFWKIQKIIEEFDKNFSRFRQDSLVTEMSQKEGTYEFPDPEMMDFYETLNKKTNGLVTPLVGNLLEQAGYDASYSLKPKKLDTPLSWNEAIEWNKPNLTLKKPALLDFGAAGKGRLVDLVGDELKKQGFDKFSVDAGGDIQVSGEQIKIALEHPEDPKLAIGFVEIENESICGSSGNRRKWGEFHHIINPQSLKSVNAISAVWTVAKSTMLADGLSTCLFFVDPEKLSDFEFDYLIVYPDYTFQKSKNFPGELYEANR